MVDPSLPGAETARHPGHPAWVAARPVRALPLLPTLLLNVWGLTHYPRGNVHMVVPDRLYRSAWLPPKKLRALVRRHQIRTVVSLMGGDDGDPWFVEEAAACAGEGATLEAARLSTRRLPRPPELEHLVRVLTAAEGPLLLHCRSGADRTGFATALFLHLVLHQSLDAAIRAALSWRYGHFPHRARALKRFFDLYRTSNGSPDLATWVHCSYAEVYSRHRRGVGSAKEL